MVNSLLDSLRLAFSEDYDISDSDYKELSDILLRNNLAAEAFDNGLVQIIKLLSDKDNEFKLPMTMNLLQDLWSDRYITLNFVQTIAPLIREGIIKIRKINKDKLQNNTTINKLQEEPDSDIVVVVYGSDKLTDMLKDFENILHSSERKEILSEGVDIIPSKIKNVISTLNNKLSTIHVNVSVESYMKDGNDSEDLNMIISNVSNYSVKSQEIQNKFSRSLGRLKYVKSVEAYKENKSELYLGLSLTSSYDLKELTSKIFTILNDLEINFA